MLCGALSRLPLCDPAFQGTAAAENIADGTVYDLRGIKVSDNSLKGLPKVLGRESQMVIPTVTSMWDQDEMCRQYGFNYLYASNDFEEGYHRNLNDEQVFQLAMQKDKDLKQPFFSVILTFSMHQPYTKLIDSTFPITDLSMPQDLI